jgi:AcrR family transcriptional regulator
MVMAVSSTTTHAEKRREEILQAAVQLILESGLGNLTTRKVAQRMGLTEGTIYRYYPSKEDLLKGVFGLFKEKFVTNATSIAGQSGLTPGQQLEAIYQRNMDIHISLNGMPMLFYIEGISTGTPEQVQILRDIFLEYHETMHSLIGRMVGPDFPVRPQELALLFLGSAAAASIAMRLGLDPEVGRRFKEEVIPFLVETLNDRE